MIARHIGLCLFVFVTSLLAVTTSASAQTNEWTFCASENGTCAFTGTKEVRYGANGTYVYKTVTGGTPCTNAVFGDPLVGVVKQCATRTSSTTTQWIFCAAENSLCRFTGTQQVRYGANGAYVYRTLTGGTSCSNDVFGDPIVNTRKQCDIAVIATSSPTSPPPPTLTLSCPANLTVASSNGSAVPVTYSVTTSGGVAPVTVVATPASGSPFPVGTTSVTVTARASDGQTANCGFTVTVSYTAPAPSYGPSPAITCPSSAVNIWPGSSIQQLVSLHPAGTTFCLRAGVHVLTSAITPKSGDTFVGEYGAVLDGSSWTTNDPDQAAFRAHNQDIDYVTIRNLVIRRMPQRGIHAFYYMSDHWTIESNEITGNTTGIVFPSHTTIRNNNIHHNTSGGYLGTFSSYSTLEGNEIAYNGKEQKIGESASVTFRNNFVHHNTGDGIWFDSNNTGALIDGNRVEDNGYAGIFYEISSDVIIRNNAVRRTAGNAIFISTSKNAQIYGNTLENNFRSITYFVNCNSVGGGQIGFDLANNTAYDNTIRVGTQTDVFATGFGYISCTSAQVSPYLNGSKNLKFSRNIYEVPSPTTGRYWLWNNLQEWGQWQSLGQDVEGVIR